ncbi:probable leucine-rich repeat receptor-like protein kinase At5g49770 [Jatropha curcas]|uniref:probable leucine-rich repeat receptor-like protein kinase At5g49770 n=1 Tax=Jatropha curcas TaxID=180498 RepID=UPI001895D07C|nr:probable leucine-rich repeat receptor-like protein kinase At5g49770 [Jatropha curcas]
MVKAFSCNSLKSLKNTWQNTPPSWGNGDPCGTPWEGVTCKNSRVTALALHKNNLTGKIPSSLAKLSNLYWPRPGR